MLLISPSKAATAIGATCWGNAPPDTDPTLIRILSLITPRVEAALNVDSLGFAEHIDRFYLTPMPVARWPINENAQPTQVQIRLRNGFLCRDSFTLKDADDVEIDFTDADIDYENGIITLYDWDKGFHTLTYQSGFQPIIPDNEPDDADPCLRVLDNIPQWMEGIVVDCLVQFYRTERINPNLPKDVSIGAINSALQRILTTRIYGKYQRPRAGVVWADCRDGY